MAEVKIIPINDIEPNKGQIAGLPKNPRFIKDEHYKKLCQSLTENPEMLELRELLVYKPEGGKKYILIGGNMRWRALKEIGCPEAPCKIIPQEATIEQLKAYTIKDNANFGEWDFNDLANEWNAGDLEAWGVDIPDVETPEPEEEAKDDNFDVEAEKESIKEPTTKLGDIWQMGEHRLICGDSGNPETLTKLMKGKKADLLLTDPPYNVDYSAKNEMLKSMDKSRDSKKAIENDAMSKEAFIDFLKKVFSVAAENLKAGGAYYIWHSSSMAIEFIKATEDELGKVRETLIWAKSNLVLGMNDYQYKHEPCLYGWKEGAGHYFAPRRDQTTVIEDLKKNIAELTASEMREILTKLQELPETIIHEAKPQKNGDHPTMKPVPLFGRLVKNSTRPGETVLDIFGGSGTTLIACEQLKRKARLIELDPVYCDVIVKRWEDLTGETAVLIR